MRALRVPSVSTSFGGGLVVGSACAETAGEEEDEVAAAAERSLALALRAPAAAGGGSLFLGILFASVKVERYSLSLELV